MPAAMMSPGGRAAHRAGVTHESGSGSPAGQRPCHEHPERVRRGTGTATGAPSMFAAVSSTGRGARRRSPRLVELKVGKGTSASQLAAHVARMKDVEYAFVPPVRQAVRHGGRKPASIRLPRGNGDTERFASVTRGPRGIQERDEYHDRGRRQRHRHATSRLEAGDRRVQEFPARVGQGFRRARHATSRASSPRPPATVSASRGCAAAGSSP